MRKNLSVEQLDGLLDQPFVATLATYRRDGSVLLSPVWHEWRDGGFNVHVGGFDDVKVRHLQRDPRASIVVYENDPPYRGIEVRGFARLIETGHQEVGRRVAARYLGPEHVDKYVSDYQAAVVIRLEPGVLRAWDFRDDYL
jgi:PPOX class probable F420-dependent enzyme